MYLITHVCRFLEELRRVERVMLHLRKSPLAFLSLVFVFACPGLEPLANVARFARNYLSVVIKFQFGCLRTRPAVQKKIGHVHSSTAHCEFPNSRDFMTSKFTIRRIETEIEPN
jgi:hypothetical protein